MNILIVGLLGTLVTRETNTMLSGERTKKDDDGKLLILVNINDSKLSSN